MSGVNPLKRSLAQGVIIRLPPAKQEETSSVVATALAKIAVDIPSSASSSAAAVSPLATTPPPEEEFGEEEITAPEVYDNLYDSEENEIKALIKAAGCTIEDETLKKFLTGHQLGTLQVNSYKVYKFFPKMPQGIPPVPILQLLPIRNREIEQPCPYISSKLGLAAAMQGCVT